MEYTINLYKETFETLKRNMVLIQPLILFFIVIGFFMMNIKGTFSIKTVLLIIIGIMLLSSVFNAGWFNMITKCVKTPHNPNLTKAELAIKSFELFKEFLPGVSLYFLHFLIGTIIYLALLGIIGFGSFSVGLDQIGIPFDINWDKLSDENLTPDQKYEYFMNLPLSVQYQLAMWEFLIILSILLMFILNFLTMFWGPCIIFIKAYPAKSYIESLKLIIKSPLRTFIISFSYSFCLSISLIIFLIPVFIIPFIGLIGCILVITYFNIMIFKHLEKQKIDNNIGPDCFR